jgi:hypothetical protein
VTKFKMLSRYLPTGIEGNLSQNSQCPGRDLNLISLEHKSEALPHEWTYSVKLLSKKA